VEYTLAKFLHVLFAIIAVGYNASYGLWLARAARQPGPTQLFTLQTIKFMDDRIANPLYGLLALTGLYMAFTAGYPLSTFWIAAALVLYVIALIIAFAVISPNFRAALRALETEGAASEGYTRAMARGRVFGALIGLVVLAIVFMMVVKPTI